MTTAAVRTPWRSRAISPNLSPRSELVDRSAVDLDDEPAPVHEEPRLARVAGILGTLLPADNMLADHATHVQDVRIGLDLRAAPVPERARAVLDAALGMSKPVTWGVRERAEGLRLEAEDIRWGHGDGPEVRGPYDALLLALGGRSAGLAHLSGAGVDVLAPRVALPL